MSVDLEKVASYIAEVADDKIVPRFQSLRDEDIQTKTSPSDLVTIADIEAEIELTRILKDVIVGSMVVGEEAVSKGETDPSILASESGYIWVIDPVDGTHNFAHGKEKFGTIVALVKDNVTVASWIYDTPQKRFAMAEKGSGVYVSGARVTYDDPKTPLRDTRGFVSRKFMPPNMRPHVDPVLEAEFGEVDTYLCCAHEYLDVLTGQAFYALYRRIRPWDHLAGAMMAAEAGGVVKQWDGSSYGPPDYKGGVLIAPNEGVWDEIHGLLLAKFM